MKCLQRFCHSVVASIIPFQNIQEDNKLFFIFNMPHGSLVPRLLEEGRKEPGTHCLCMRLIPLTFQGSGYFLCMSVYCDVTDGRVTDRSRTYMPRPDSEQGKRGGSTKRGASAPNTSCVCYFFSQVLKHSRRACGRLLLCTGHEQGEQSCAALDRYSYYSEFKPATRFVHEAATVVLCV